MAERIPGARLVVLPGDDHLPSFGDQGALLDAFQEFLTGTRSQSPPERVLGTVLVTDIVSSTEHAARLGDRAWLLLRKAHNEAVRAQVDRFRGRETMDTGDGLIAVFDGPTRAISCAVQATRAVRELGIEIRAGVHTGEIELTGGQAVGGIALHIATRVANLARPSEVLASRTVKDLSVGSGFAFEDHGAHTLKGVPDEWMIYAVREAAS